MPTSDICVIIAYTRIILKISVNELSHKVWTSCLIKCERVVPSSVDELSQKIRRRIVLSTSCLDSKNIAV